MATTEGTDRHVNLKKLVTGNARIVPIIAIAAALRVYQIGSHSLWLDEAFSYHYVTTRSLRNLLFMLPQTDPHPPLYYVVLELWTTVAGTSEAALRFPSAVFGTAAIGAQYYLVKGVFDEETGLLAALLLALSPIYVSFSQETRMYSLAVLLTIVATHFLYCAVRSPSRRYVAAYVASAVLLGYTHVWGLFVLGAHAVYVAILPMLRRNRRNSRSVWLWAATYGLIGFLLSPWLSILLWRAVFTNLGSITWLSPPSVKFLLETPVQWITGSGVHPSLWLVVPVAITAGITWSIQAAAALNDRVAGWITALSPDSASPRRVADGVGPHGGLFVVLLLVPIAAGVILSHFIKPMYHIRSTLLAAVGFYALLARGAVLSRRFTPGNLVAVALVIGLLLPLPGYYAGSSDEPWRDVTDRIEQRADSNDLILITDSYMQVPYAYYSSDTRATIRTVPEGATSDKVRARYPSVPPGDVQELTTNHDTVWLISSHVSTDHEAQLRAEIRPTSQLAERRSHSAITVRRYEPTRRSK